MSADFGWLPTIFPETPSKNTEREKHTLTFPAIKAKMNVGIVKSYVSMISRPAGSSPFAGRPRTSDNNIRRKTL